MNKMNIRRTIVIATTMIITTFMLVGCTGGNSVSGKWYPITPDAATASGSMQLNSGGEFVTDGLKGEWYEEDGVVQIDIVGFHEVYTLGEYEGYQVLYKQGKDYPSFCRSAEDAEAVYDILSQ